MEITHLVVSMSLAMATTTTAASAATSSCRFNKDEIQMFELREPGFSHSPLELAIPKIARPRLVQRGERVLVMGWTPEAVEAMLSKLLGDGQSTSGETTTRPKPRLVYSLEFFLKLHKPGDLNRLRRTFPQPVSAPYRYTALEGPDPALVLVMTTRRPGGMIDGSAFTATGLRADFFSSDNISEVTPSVTPERVGRFAAELLLQSIQCAKE